MEVYLWNLKHNLFYVSLSLLEGAKTQLKNLKFAKLATGGNIFDTSFIVGGAQSHIIVWEHWTAVSVAINISQNQ